MRIVNLVGLLLLACGGAVPPALEISTPQLPPAVRGAAYLAVLQATGGTPPLSWSVASVSQLPAGLRLDATGKLAGTPEVPGRFTLGLDVTDGRGARASAGYLLVVADDADAGVTRTSCAAPIEIDLSSGVERLDGTFADAADLQLLSCHGEAREQVYTFQLSEPADISLTDAQTTNTTRTYRSLRAAPCTGGAELSCTRDSNNTDSTVHRVPAGRYYVLLESDGVSPSAAYSVLVRRLPPTPAPANDTCAAATAVTFTMGSANLTGTLAGATPEPAPPVCNGAREADVWFSIPVDAPSRLTFEVGAVGEVYSGTCGALAPTRCLQGKQCVDVEQPGTQLLRVSGGSRELAGVVTREPFPAAPPNETCATATPIALVSGSGTASGRLWRAQDDVKLPCMNQPGGDAVHLVTLGQRSDVAVDVVADGTYLGAGLFSGGCGAPQLRACMSGYRSGLLRGWGLEAGTYALVVDGAGNDSCWDGDYVVNVTATPSVAPANDTCAGAEDVVFANGLATLAGSTRGAANDATSAACSFLSAGPDVVYRVTLAQSARLRLLTTASYSDMSLRVISGDCLTGAVVACRDARSTLETPLLAPGTHHLVVDGADVAGDFQLIAQQF